MANPRDICVSGCELYFIPTPTRVPLKFGAETLTYVTCARARVFVTGREGAPGFGWGETPLSAAWVWPSADLTQAERDEALRELCRIIAVAFAAFPEYGHAMEIGHCFLQSELPRLLRDFNQRRPNREPAPWLAALACFSLFDLAVHDAYAARLGEFVYDTYDAGHMNRDLSWFFGPDEEGFEGKYPSDFLVASPPASIPVWHLVGGMDPLLPDDAAGDEPDDGYPVFLPDWIARDGLKRLKVKLRGDDAEWDYFRLSRVGDIARSGGVECLAADFNCMVLDPAYVVWILERLAVERRELHDMLLYVEQPFPRDLLKYRMDVHAVSRLKPLYLDESAHDWEHVAFGLDMGWTGVALKTCKTQSGTLLSLCWAKAHGMGVMVQDLTNPMLAQIPHVLLAAHAGSVMGVESNAMQFYPGASLPEAAVHPGLYRRRDGVLNLASLGHAGFGYRVDEMRRELPEKEDLSNVRHSGRLRKAHG